MARRERERQEVAAALAEVQARQACLSRGTVFQRPTSTSDTRPATNEATTATAAAAARGRPAQGNNPRLLPELLWVRKPVVRCRDKQQQAVDAVGSVEFVASASLAGVRVLVDQFLLLPPRRRYEFVHPTTHARVEPADEKFVFPADFPCVMLMVLPVDKVQLDAPVRSPGATSGRTSPQRSPIAMHEKQHQSPKPKLRAKTKPALDDSERKREEEVVDLFALEEGNALLERDDSSDQSARSTVDEPLDGSYEEEGSTRDETLEEDPSAGPALSLTEAPREQENYSEGDLESKQKQVTAIDELEQISSTVERRQTFRLDIGSYDAETESADEKVNPIEPRIKTTDTMQTAAEGQEPSVGTTEQLQPLPSHGVPHKENTSPQSRRTSLLDKSPQRAPHALRRARRFKSLSPSKLPESSWEDDQNNLLENVVVRQAQALIKEIVEVFFGRLEGSSTTDSSGLFSSKQLKAAFENYGVDCCVLGLNGVLLALNDELSIRCAETPDGIDVQLAKYLLTTSPMGDNEAVNTDTLPRFECALNVFSGMRLWFRPTQLRTACMEEAYPMHFVPISDNKRLSLLRFSERDRELCTFLYSNCLEPNLEKWLMDGLELTYLLLYAFLQSKRNAGVKTLAKLDFVSSQRERVQAVTRKISSFNLEAWKTLELRVSDISDFCMAKRTSELLKPFLSRSNQHSSELESCSFFPTLVEYLAKKTELLSQSISELLVDNRRVQSSPLVAKGFLRSLHEHFGKQEGDPPSIEGYLLNTGLKVIDVEKINAARSSTGLGRIYIDGRAAIVTHRQCELMATDNTLRLKSRWDRQQLRDDGACTRYVFHGNRNVALEFVYVSTATGNADMSWEEKEVVAKEELQKAFELLCSEALEIPPGTWIGTGINMMHADLLPRITSLLPVSAILREYVHATSVSFGYHTDDHGTRVVFRVHAESNTLGQTTSNDCKDEQAQVQSIMEELERFLRRAGENELVAFCEADGISFLNSRLSKQRGQQWSGLVFGEPFYRYMHSRGFIGKTLDYPRDDILQCMNILLPVVARLPRCITEENLRIIVGLATVHVEDTDTGSIIAPTALETIRVMCCGSPGNMPTSLHSQFVAMPMTETQRYFSARGGFKLLVDATDKLNDLPDRKAVVKTSILSLMMTREICGTEGGLLVHWQDWLSFYVENDAWETCEGKVPLLVFLLGQIHTHFFHPDDFTEPATAVCFCGCNGHMVEVRQACAGLMRMFLQLMRTDAGILWAQEDMRGPHDCISFLEWSMQARHEASPGAELQQPILDALCSFLERMTSSHQYLHFLSTLTPRLLKLLRELESGLLQAAATRVLSLAFRLAVDRKVWTVSLETFLEPFYQILEALCDDDSTASSMNIVMVNTLFGQNSGQQVVGLRNHLLSLLHEEHANFVGGCGQLSPVTKSRSKSFLQSLASFCSLTWSSVLQPSCQLPALITLGWVLNSPDLAEDLMHLEVDELLLTLIENDHPATSILAIRAFTMLLFQGLLTRRVFDDHRLRKLCNLLTTALGAGARMALGSQWAEEPDNPQVLLFAASQSDTHTLLHRYSAFNHEKQMHAHHGEDDIPAKEQLPVTSVWGDHEWEDPARVAPAKLVADLKLLAVFSTLTASVLSVKHSDEMRQLVELLVRFVRDRVHVAAHHALLYLFSLRNLVWALRSDLPRWGISEFVETGFLRKLLEYSQSRLSKLHQELASGILWGLADAFGKTNTFVLSFEVKDKLLVKDSEPCQTTGLSMLVDNLVSKIASEDSVEGDAGLLASLLVNSVNSVLFIEGYGYPFVVKLIESMRRSTRPASRDDTILKPEEEQRHPVSLADAFGVELFYSRPIKLRKDRELLQLCRVAVKTLQAMQHLSPKTIQDEIARTKTTMLPLLDHENDLVVLRVLSCCIAHLQASPTKCTKLLAPEVQDKIIAMLFHDDCPQLQAAAFTCMKLALADQACFASPTKLQDKVAPLLEQIVQCLRSPHFEVKRKAMVFLVELAFRLEDEPGFVATLADSFATPSNQDILMELFETLSRDFEQNPAAGSVLQLLVRLILKLDLTAHTDGGQLVDAICLMLKTHSDDTFLRPMLCSCLAQIAVESGSVEHLARKNTLAIILELLAQKLTMGELRDVAKLLLTLATKHSGIRQFLSRPVSGCMVRIGQVLRAFTTHLKEDSSAKSPLQRHTKTSSIDNGSREEEQVQVPASTDSARYLLKVTAGKKTYISHYTEDVYEQFMRLLLLLVRTEGDWLEERSGCPCREKAGCSKCDPCDAVAKARCGHLILRLSIAHRILSADFSLEHLLSAEGSSPTSVTDLSIQALMILATNHQGRLQMLGKTDWAWIPCLVKLAECSDAGTAPDWVINTIMLLGHLSAEKEVAERLLAERHFVTLLFSYMALSTSNPSLASSVKVQRASSFTLARLAEYPKLVQDSVFQGQMALLLRPTLSHDDSEIVGGEQDTVVRANKMVLVRNRAMLTPGFQGRAADESNVTTLMELLRVSKESTAGDTPFEVALIAVDVLASILFVNMNSRDKLRTYSMMMRHARVIGSTDERQERDTYAISYKRLAGSIRRWLAPMLVEARHQGSSGAYHDDSTRLLMDEVKFAYSLLDDPTPRGLLSALLSLELEPPSIRTMTQNANDVEPDREVSDEIPSFDRGSVLLERTPFLQYVFPATDRLSCEANDQSFHGSAHTWLFLRKLWDFANKKARYNEATESTENREAKVSIVTNIPLVISRWSSARGFKYSAVAYQRRQCFLEFVAAVMQTEASVADAIEVSALIDLVEANAADPNLGVGKEFELLYRLCQRSPEHIDAMMDHFELETATTDEDPSLPSGTFHLFWSAARLQWTSHQIALPLFPRQSRTPTSVTMLEPCTPSETALAFAIGLLKLLSERAPRCVQWFAERHGLTLLLDALLLVASIPILRMQDPVLRMLLSNLLELVQVLVKAEPDKYHCILAADPRYLRCVIELVHGASQEVQIMAMELLKDLALQPSLFALLYHVETLSRCIAVVEPRTISYWETKLTRHKVAPVLPHELVVVIAHVIQVPFFTDLTTPELVKLSVGFIRCEQTDEEALMLVDGGCQFSAIPDWMFDPKNIVPASFRPIMEQLSDAFTSLLSQSPEGPNRLLALRQDAYLRCTTVGTRRQISIRLTNLLQRKRYGAEAKTRRSRSRSGLIARLARLLIEDRAEVNRRVSFVRNISVRAMFEQTRRHQLSDLLPLLESCPLFEGVHRDGLACLAFQLGQPQEVSIGCGLTASNLPLTLVFDDDVEFEMSISGGEETLRGSLRRGGILGFPTWLSQVSSDETSGSFSCNKSVILGVTVSLESLKSGLPEADLAVVIRRIGHIFGSGNPQDILQLSTASSTGPKSLEQQRRLQSSASSLLAQLATSRGFLENLLNNDWTVSVLLEVALGALPAQIVNNALQVVVAIAASESFCKRFCAKQLKAWSNRDEVAQTDNAFGVVTEFVGRFKLCLWQGHTEILQRFFEIQSHMGNNLPVMWTVLEKLWTADYLRSCYYLLQTTNTDQRRAAEVVARHLASAIPHRPDYLLRCSRELGLHLQVITALVKINGGDSTNLLQLLLFLCSDDALREEVWDTGIAGPNALDGVLKLVAAGICSCVELGVPAKLEIYCEFLYLICTSDVAETLDKEFRRLVESRFGIMSMLLQRVNTFPGTRQTILRCISSMCADEPGNCRIAAMMELRSGDGGGETSLAAITQSNIGRLEKSLAEEEAIDICLVEATFSCIRALSCSRGESTRFYEKDITGLALGTLSALASTLEPPNEQRVAAWQSIVTFLGDVIAQFNVDVVDIFGGSNVRVLTAGLSHVSDWYAASNDSLKRGRLLRDYMGLLSQLVADQYFRDELWAAYLCIPDNENQLVGHIYQWLIFRGPDAPAIARLAPKRSKHMNNLLGVTQKLEATAVGVATMLTQHSEAAQMLCLHPDFVKVVDHIFRLLSSGDWNEELASTWLQFLCFAAEQWESHSYSDEVRAKEQLWLPHFRIVALVQISRLAQQTSDVLVCYALRLTWLISYARMRATNHDGILDDWSSSAGEDEHITLVALACEFISSQHVSKRAIANVLGVLADLASTRRTQRWLGEAQEQLLNVVETLLRALNSGLLQITQETAKVAAIVASPSSFSSLQWRRHDSDAKLEIERLLDFALGYQALRFVLRLCEAPRCFAILLSSSFFHSKTCQTLFPVSVMLLGERGSSDFWLNVQTDCLRLLTVLLSSADGGSPHAENMFSPVIQSYRRVARRERLLPFCVKLLPEAPPALKHEVVRTLKAYITFNVGASEEVAILRERRQGDLMEMLLTIVKRGVDERPEQKSELWSASLLLFNAIIEFSFANAAYAACPQHIQSLQEIRLSMGNQGALLESDLPQTLFFVVRMVGSSPSGVGKHVLEEVWELVTILFLADSISTRLKPLVEVLEIIHCTSSAEQGLAQYVARDWETRGRAVVSRLLEITAADEWYESYDEQCNSRSDTIGAMAGQALVDLVASNWIPYHIKDDRKIADALLLERVRENLSLTLRKRLLVSVLTTTRHADCVVVHCLMDRYDHFAMLEGEQPILLLALLPTMVECLDESFVAWLGSPAHETTSRHWMDLLGSISAVLTEDSHGDDLGRPLDTHRLAAHEALYTLLDLCSSTDFLGDESTEMRTQLEALWVALQTSMHETWIEPLGIASLLPMHNAEDGSSLDQMDLLSVPTQLQVLELANLIKLAPLIEMEVEVEDQLAKACFSLWMSESALRLVNGKHGDETHALSQVIFFLVTSSHYKEILQGVQDFPPFWRTLVRMLATTDHEPLRRDILAMVLHLLQGPSGDPFLEFVETAMNFDLIDALWWESRSNTRKSEKSSDTLRALWCSLLTQLCKTRVVAVRIMEARFLEDFVALEHQLSSDEMLELPGNVTLFALLTTAFRLTDDTDHARFFRVDNHSATDTLAELCVRTVTAISGPCSTKHRAMEVLQIIALNPEALKIIGKACHLDTSDDSEVGLLKQNARLQALSDMILLTENSIEALIRVLTVLRQLCSFEGGVPALIHSREAFDCWSLLELLTDALQQSTYDPEDPRLKKLRVVDFATTDLESFLPCSLQSPHHVEAATLALELVRFCAFDQTFGDALQTDSDLLQEMFVGLASSHWRVAHAASMALSAAIRCSHERKDQLRSVFDGETPREAEIQDDEDNVARYICSHDPTRSNSYRRLEFLADIDDQELFEMSPSSRFPSCFVLLIRWLRFYSVNLTLLSSLPSLEPAVEGTVAHETLFSDGKHQAANRALHEELVASILELLLYLVANFHSVIYNSANGEEEEHEHALVLHALVALCQRRNNDEAIPGSPGSTFSSEIVVAEALLRCRALDLVQLLCSLNLPHTSSVEVFAEPRKMLILLSIVESTSSAAEQRAATQLLQALALHGAIKELLVGDPRLLSRLGAWLENPQLQLLSASILRRLAAKSSISHAPASMGTSMFAFVPSIQEQLAHFLFVGTGVQSPSRMVQENWGSMRQRPRVLPTLNSYEVSATKLRHVQVSATVQVKPTDVRETNGKSKPVCIKLRLETVNYEGERIREFQHSASLCGTGDQTTHTFLAERTEVMIRCRIFVALAGSKRRWLVDGKQFEYPLGDVEALARTQIFRRDAVTLCLSDSPETSRDNPSPSETGVLARLLRKGIDVLPPKLARDSTAIVAEFCKNALIFSDPTVDLPSQIRTVMTTSVRCRPDSTMDLVCLEALAAWFRSKPSLGFFQTNVLPLLRLIQGLRQAPLDTRRLSLLHQRQINSTDSGTNRVRVGISRHVDFLTALVEWMASVDAPDLTANCLNVLFMENADVLLYLCSQLYPQQSTYASFFSLVTLATRANISHCQTFAAPHAVRLLLETFETGCKEIAEDDEISRGELLSFAARVVLKLARCSTARQAFTVRADGLRLYSRIGFEIYAQRSWKVHFPREAAENLILASAFLCDGLSGVIAVNSASHGASRFEALLAGSQTRQSGLTVVETLMLFLGRHTKHGATEVSPVGSGNTFDSFDRLAATTTSALAEKLPSRVKFEQHVLQLLEAWYSLRRVDIQEGQQDSGPVGRHAWIPDQCLAGLQRCLVLTQYDFQSDLNTLRRTYYASIRAGVRKGVIPPQCSGILQRFDRDHLLSRIGHLWQFPSTAGSTQVLQRLQSRGHLSDGDLVSDTRRISTTPEVLTAEDAALEAELRELVLFADEHAEVVAALKANRKKALTASLRTATNNARVLTACHAMTSIILDFYVDTTACGLRQASQKSHHERSSIGGSRYLIQRSSKRKVVDLGDSDLAVFYEWLLLLEEMAGLLCCGLHELDAQYYSELARQCQVLILELPSFLHKMERTYSHSRQQAVLLFLSNLHSLLKRVTNRNELRVVAANGFGVVEQAKVVRERLQKLDAPISVALGALLESPNGMGNLTRALAAMEYMWRRIMGTTDLEEFMERMKETRSLMSRIKEKLVRVWGVIRHPLQAIRALFVKLWELITFRRTAQEASLPLHAPGQLQRLQSEVENTARSTDTNTTFRDEKQPDCGVAGQAEEWGKGSSPFPFCSVELLLDHLGLESLPAKRTKQLLHSPTLRGLGSGKNLAVELLSNAFELDDTEIEKLDIEDLAEFFHDVQGTDEGEELLSKLSLLAQEGDMSFMHLPRVVREKCKVNLWRLLVRPVQRIRLIHLYQQVRRFVRGDNNKRQLMLEGYHRIKRQRSSLQTLGPWRDFPHEQSDRGVELTPKSQADPEPSPPRLGIFRLPFRQRIVAGDTADGDTGVPVVGGSALVSKVVLTRAVLSVCDGISGDNPFSEKAAVARLRRDNEAKKRQRRNRRRWWHAKLGRTTTYREDDSRSLAEAVFIAIRLLAARFVLLIAFWRRGELREDLHDPMLASAFDNPRERDEFYLTYHARKGLMEILRVWMTSSGTLGLRLWQQQRYFVVGMLLSVLITQWLPFHVEFQPDDGGGGSSVASKRNVFMTRIVYGYGVGVFFLAVVSIVLIARNRFVLLAQSRLRLRPVSRYYQNVMAMAAIVVELVQLSSLAFDSSIEWNESEQLPSLMQWMGRLGFTQFAISQVSELQSLAILTLLFAWFVLLKCANRFQETSALLDRLLTKDIPAVVHSFLYMGTISAFFSFLACVDCSGPYGQLFRKCAVESPPAPFLITHQSVECWTMSHRWYALLGFWGITFFVPVGLLAHGMSQVLFQRETLDVKYAPVLLLVSQLVKAAAATAQSFFPFNSMWLAGLGLVGNAILLVLMMTMRSCSLWYIKYIKCGVYASGCWASLGAIHRLQHAEESSSRSLNLIYLGWISIVAVTASAMLLRVWRHAGMKQLEDQKRFAAQRRLLSAGNPTAASASELNDVERKFLRTAKRQVDNTVVRAAFAENARKLDASSPPTTLQAFVDLARETRLDAPANAVLVQNARMLARRLHSHEDLRRRR